MGGGSKVVRPTRGTSGLGKETSFALLGFYERVPKLKIDPSRLLTDYDKAFVGTNCKLLSNASFKEKNNPLKESGYKDFLPLSWIRHYSKVKSIYLHTHTT